MPARCTASSSRHSARGPAHDLETFITAFLSAVVRVFIFLPVCDRFTAHHPPCKKKEKCFYGSVQHLHGPVFQSGKHHMANAGHVGRGRPAHLSWHCQKNGAHASGAHGLRRHSGEPAPFGRHHPGQHRGPHHRFVPRGHEQRAVPPAAVHRHRRHDRLWAPSGAPVADAVRRSRTVRRVFHLLPGRLFL